MADAQVIFLVSSTTTDQAQEIGQRRVRDMLIAKRVAFREIDGSDANHKEERDELFGIAGVRGKYPYVFVAKTYVGGWEKVQELAECDDLPTEILASAKPPIPTFSSVFGVPK